MADRNPSQERKHSPDVLAELLGTELPAAPMPDLGPRAAPPRTARAQPPADARPKVAPKPVLEPAPACWETEIVTLQDHKGWRPRYVNGVEVPNWLTGPLVHDYLATRGAEGWEVAGACAAGHFYGVADGLQLFLKRRR